MNDMKNYIRAFKVNKEKKNSSFNNKWTQRVKPMIKIVLNIQKINIILK